MKRHSKEINIFSMSALDLFASALGAFILIAIVLFPYFPNIGSSARLPHLDLVIALDTTGSMGSPIGGLKQELQGMTQVLSELVPSLGVGIVAFNDRRNDPVIATSQFKEVRPGSANFNSLKNFIDALQAGSADGANNDWPEAVYQALQAAQAMPWRSISEKKIIVVVTDAPPYSDEYDAIMGEARNFAAESGQSVSGVWVDSQGQGHNAAAIFLEKLSENGKGRFVKAGGSITTSILLACLGT